MKVVLFCGGLGMRMREGTNDAPKPMAMIGDRPLLWHVMRYYAHFGHTDFVLCLGYGARAVKEYFLHYDETLTNDFSMRAGSRDIEMFATDITDWNITFVDTGRQSTIGERLLRVRDHVDGEEMFLANYSDTLTNAPLPQNIARFEQSGASASLLAVPPVSTHHVVEIDEGGYVARIREFSEMTQWENGGYFILRPDVFDALRSGEDLFPHAVRRLAAERRFLAQPYEGFWRAVDTFKDRAEMEAMYESGCSPWMVWNHAQAGRRA
jgi:glucose-1-phosphate cytidylyltransferase